MQKLKKEELVRQLTHKIKNIVDERQSYGNTWNNPKHVVESDMYYSISKDVILGFCEKVFEDAFKLGYKAGYAYAIQHTDSDGLTSDLSIDEMEEEMKGEISKTGII